MEAKVEKYYYAGSYSRLSKEDGDKKESDSIKNQKELIQNCLKLHPDIILRKEYSDDGYSGVTFERPAFQSMMDDVRDKQINCIVVKDLSRLGRNYIETGKYVEQIFPFLGVRFIAVNDNYDSEGKKQLSDQLILPFKNLINDIYCRDISIKVRSNLNAKKSKGDFAAAFAPYGYLKEAHNKSRLMIDPPAARVVTKIFQLKLDGNSNTAIADILNREGILTPCRYKQQTKQGKNYKPDFSVGAANQWSNKAIARILANEVYLGHLLQGKSSRPNYKIKKQLPIKREAWIRVDNTHEPIISAEAFQLVQKLLLIDTRAAPGKGQIYLFSGFLYCGNCKKMLLRRSIRFKQAEYTYYGCYAKDKTLNCQGVSIREEVIARTVLIVMQKYMGQFVQSAKLLPYMGQRMDRRTLAVLVAEIAIYSNKSIRICFSYPDELTKCTERKTEDGKGQQEK